MNKNIVIEHIRENYPDIEKMNFSYGGINVDTFVESQILPLLFYYNATSQSNRIITLFLPQNSKASFLLPFVSAFASYRTSIIDTMKGSRFENKKFVNHEKQIVYNGTVYSIIYIDYITRHLILQDGCGRRYDVDFAEALYCCQWGYLNAKEIYETLKELEELHILEKKDVFKFPLNPFNHNYKGVMLFSNVSKFEELTKVVKINGNDIRDVLNVQKTIFSELRNSIELKPISKQRTFEKPVSVVVSRIDSFRAFNQIISENQETLRNINTIVLDDFDQVLYKHWKNNELEEFVQSFKLNICKLLDHQIKNVYLICENRNFDIFPILKKAQISTIPWLLTPNERIVLNNAPVFFPKITIKRICNIEFEEVRNKLLTTIREFKELAISTNSCNGEILEPISNLFEIRAKLNSFSSILIFKALISESIKGIISLKEKWFYSGSDYGLLDRTIEFLQCLDEMQVETLNCKLQALIEILANQSTIGDRSVKIFCSNENKEDKDFALNYLSDRVPGITVEILEISEYQSFKGSIDQNDYVVFFPLKMKRDIKGTFNQIFLNPKFQNNIFILSDQEFEYAKQNFVSGSRIVTEIASQKFKYNLLGIPEASQENNLKLDLIEVELIESENTQDLIPVAIKDNGDEQSSLKISDLESFSFIANQIAEDLIKNKKKALDGEQLRIFFKDGTNVEWPKYKRVFCLDENKDGDEISLEKDALDLKNGDQIILPKRSDELRNIINETLATSEKYKELILFDNLWRSDIESFIIKVNGSYEAFKHDLRNNGFEILSDHTIKNWINGDTMMPHNFKQLLVALSRMKLVDSEKLGIYYKNNKNLKKIKLEFVKKAIIKLILSFKSISTAGDEVFDDDLLDKFIDHISIKKVVAIIKF